MSKYNFENIQNNGSKIVCVFGCLLSENGKKIKKEMLSWLTTKYDVICVNQEYPGTLYEWPAMKFARQYSIDNNVPVLYIHTKGAFNENKGQEKVRKLWKQEFIDNYDWYENIVLNDSNAVAAPFVADCPHGITWFNGFIAGPDAWKKTNLDYPSESRWIYEYIFKNCEINQHSRIISSVNINNCFKRNKPFTDMMQYINNI